MLSRRPSVGWNLLDRTGLLEIIFPELAALKGVETKDGRGHKDIFSHTLQVLDNVAAQSGDLFVAISYTSCQRYTLPSVIGYKYILRDYRQHALYIGVLSEGLDQLFCRYKELTLPGHQQHIGVKVADSPVNQIGEPVENRQNHNQGRRTDCHPHGADGRDHIYDIM